MAGNPWIDWPPSKDMLRDMYFGGWTKDALAFFFGRDIAEVDKLLKGYQIGPRPPKPVLGQSRVPRNNHAGDAVWVYCQRCRHKHCLAPPRPEGCGFGYVKTPTKWDEHNLTLRDGYKCRSCGFVPKPFSGLPWKDNHLEMQHILPLSRGGSNCLHNLVWLCAPCHRKLAKGKVYGGIPERISPPKP